MVTHTPSFILFIKGLATANQQLVQEVSSRIHDLTIVEITNGLQAQRVQDGPYFTVTSYPTLIQAIQTNPVTFRKYVGMEIHQALGGGRTMVREHSEGAGGGRSDRDDRTSRSEEGRGGRGGGLYGDPAPRKAGRKVVVVREPEDEPEYEPFEEPEEPSSEEEPEPRKKSGGGSREVRPSKTPKTPKLSKGRELAKKKLEPREQREPKSVAKGRALAQRKLSVLAKKKNSKRRGMGNIMAAAKSMEKEMEQAYEYDD